jgi:N-formylglutamate amidohydrolase
MDKFKKIVLNIPHSVSTMPLNNGWGDDIQAEIDKWTDWHTDTLFAPTTNNIDRVKPVIFPVSRFYCDAERLLNDPMENIGQGIVYKEFNGKKRNLTHSEECKAMAYWYLHQTELSDKLCPHALIIDCHSFPTEVAPDVDICIGYNQGWSRPDYDMIEYLCKAFEDMGYKVSLNSPYTNSITPVDCNECYYKSVMIEVNKKIYLSEDNKLLPSAYKLNIALNYLYSSLLE